MEINLGGVSPFVLTCNLHHCTLHGSTVWARRKSAPDSFLHPIRLVGGASERASTHVQNDTL